MKVLKTKADRDVTLDVRSDVQFIECVIASLLLEIASNCCFQTIPIIRFTKLIYALGTKK